METDYSEIEYNALVAGVLAGDPYSRACLPEAGGTLRNHICYYCGKLLIRKKGEHPKAFIERHHCDRKCHNSRENRVSPSQGREHFRLFTVAPHSTLARREKD